MTPPGATIDDAALADIERTVRLWQDARLPPREVWHAITGYWRPTAKWHDVRALMCRVVLGRQRRLVQRGRRVSPSRRPQPLRFSDFPAAARDHGSAGFRASA